MTEQIIMKQRYLVRLAQVLLALPLGALAAPLAAQEPGVRDIVVYLEDDDPLLFDRWETLMIEASRRLFDATEGQVRFGKVLLTSALELKKQASIRVLRSTAGTEEARTLHRKGTIVVQRSYADANTGFMPAVVVHELGHLWWGLRDEYRGCFGPRAAFRLSYRAARFLLITTPGFGCTKESTEDPDYDCDSYGSAESCIMGLRRFNTVSHARHAFCNSAEGSSFLTRHNGVYPSGFLGLYFATDQEMYYGKSCWEVIEARGGLARPEGDTLSDSTGFLVPDVCRIPDPAVVGDGDLAVSLVLDNSGSMSGLPLRLAKYGARLAVGLFPSNELLGVVKFSSGTSEVVPLAPMSTGHRYTTKQAIKHINLQANGFTAVGDALLLGRAQLSAVDASSKVIVLLSDGRSNIGPERTSPAVLSALQSESIRVYSIALGSAVDTATLSTVASATGGRFFAAQTPEHLLPIFRTIIAELAGGESVLDEPGGGSAGSALAASSDAASFFRVPSGSESLVVSLNLAYGQDAALPELELVRPDGSIVTSRTVPPGGRHDVDEDQCVYELQAPAAGLWSARVRGPRASVPHELFAFASSPGFTVDARAATPTVPFPEPVRLSVDVVDLIPLLGARVRAVVIDPEGEQRAQELSLFDDGLPSHGDDFEGDGVYSASFWSYDVAGDYRFDVTVAEEEADPAGDVVLAHTSVLVSVTDVPGEVVAGTVQLTGAPSTEVDRVSSETFTQSVLSFGLEATSEEPLLVESLAVTAEVPLSLARLGSIWLVADGDADGLPSASDTFLGRAELAAGLDRIVFSGVAGEPLTAIAPEGSAHFLLVVARAVPGADGSGVLGGSSGPIRGAFGGTWFARLALALLLLLLVRCTRDRARRLVPVAAAAGFLGFAVLSNGCSSGSSPGVVVVEPESPLQGELRLELALPDVHLSGTLTNESPLLVGEAISQTTRFVP